MHSIVGRLILVPSLLGLILASGCGGSSHSSGFVDNRPWAEKSFSFDVPRESQTTLGLQGVSGTIEVKGTPGADSIAITGVKRVQANTQDDADAHLTELEVVVTNSATETLVETVQPKFSAGRNYIVNYTISLPQDIDCSILSVNGQILVDAIHGSVFLRLVSGGITASVTLPSAGEIDMRLANGNIDLQIPQTTSAQFSAAVAIGSISLTNLSLFNETVTPNSRTGTLGGGDGTISLDAGNGAIAVRGI